MINFEEIIEQTKRTIYSVEHDKDFYDNETLQEYVQLYKIYLESLMEEDLNIILKRCRGIRHARSRCYMETTNDWNKSCLDEVDKLYFMNNELLKKYYYKK